MKSNVFVMVQIIDVVRNVENFSSIFSNTCHLREITGLRYRVHPVCSLNRSL